MSQPVLTAVRHDGKVTAMPYTLSTPTLFYNADLFTEAGLDPAKPPTTIDEAQRAGLAIAKTGGASGVYFDIAGASKSDFLTQSVIAANGGSVVSSTGAVTVDQPPAVEALTAMQNLTKSGAQPAVAEAYTIITSKIGYLPLRPGLIDDPKYLKPYYTKDPRIGPAVEQLETVTPYTFFNGAQADRAVATLQDDAVAPIVLQGADPARTLTAVADELRSITGR